MSEQIINNCARVVDLEQGSTDWHKWRMSGIGASEIPSVMGENQYQSARALFDIKTGRAMKQAANAFTAHGHRMEPVARERYFALYSEPLMPATFESVKMPFIRASVDGINMEGDLIVEIKCPKTRKVFDLAASGVIAAHYVGQVQAQLFVTGAAKAHFFVFFENETALVEVHPDLTYHDRMVKKVQRFWGAVQANTWYWGTLPQIPNDDAALVFGDSVKALDLSNDKEWCTAASAYTNAKREMARFEQIVEAQGAILKAMATVNPTYGAGVTVKRSERIGAVDYGKIPAIQLMTKEELDDYRKKGTTITSIEIG